MNQQSQKAPVPSNVGLLVGQLRGVRIILALIADRRIPIRYKLIPIGAFLYAILPFDLPGPIDDMIVLYVGPTFFLALCRDRKPVVYEELYDRLFPAEKENGENEGS